MKIVFSLNQSHLDSIVAGDDLSLVLISAINTVDYQTELDDSNSLQKDYFISVDYHIPSIIQNPILAAQEILSFVVFSLAPELRGIKPRYTLISRIPKKASANQIIFQCGSMKKAVELRQKREDDNA